MSRPVTDIPALIAEIRQTWPTTAEALRMMDKDGDGLVSLDELATTMSTPHAAPEA